MGPWKGLGKYGGLYALGLWHHGAPRPLLQISRLPRPRRPPQETPHPSLELLGEWEINGPPPLLRFVKPCFYLGKIAAPGVARETRDMAEEAPRAAELVVLSGIRGGEWEAGEYGRGCGAPIHSALPTSWQASPGRRPCGPSRERGYKRRWRAAGAGSGPPLLTAGPPPLLTLFTPPPTLLPLAFSSPLGSRAS